MKKAIALFSTLLILVLVIMLMSVALKNTSNIKKISLSDRYLIQENLTITDIKKILDNKIFRKLKDLKSEDKVKVLNKLFSTPFEVLDSVNNSNITVTLKSNDGKVNINYITDHEQKKYIGNIFIKIGVLDSDMLTEILLANIESSSKYRDDYKMSINNLDYKNGNITNYSDFKKIIEIYVKHSEDVKAYDINYLKYFKFLADDNARNTNLDINYMEIELLDAIENMSLKNSIRTKIKTKKGLFKKYSELELNNYNEVNEEDSLRKKSIGFITRNIICKINIKSINYSVQYIFNYNIENYEVSNIRLDRWVY